MRGRLERVENDHVHGWMWDPAQPERHVAFDLCVDGTPVGSFVADRLRQDLRSRSIGTGHHSFKIPLEDAWLPGGEHLITVVSQPEGKVVDKALKVVVDGDGPAADPAAAGVPAPPGVQKAPSTPEATGDQSLRGKIEECENGLLRGWAWDPSHPDLRLEPTVLVDARPIGRARADLLRRDLTRNGIGDGRHGFELLVPAHLRDGTTHRVSLRFDGTNSLPANHVRDLKFPSVPQSIVGRVEGVRGGALVGWCWDRADPTSRIELECLARGEIIGVVVADVLRSDLVSAGVGDGQHAFRFPLAPEVLDGDDDLAIAVRTSKEFGRRAIGSVNAQSYEASRATDFAKADEPSPAAKRGPAPEEDAERDLTVGELLVRAMDAESARDLPTARRALERVLAEDPENFDALFRMARVTLALGDLPEAKAIATRANAARPGHAKPSIVLARVAEAEGERANALEWWQNIPSSDSAYPERLLKSARMLVALERPDEALDLLEEAVTLKPKDRRFLQALAQLLDDRGDLDRALDLWRRTYEQDESNSRARNRIRVLSGTYREPSYTTLPRRYRSALSAADRPAGVFTGPDPTDVLIGCSLAAFLHAHFEAPVRVVTPMTTSFGGVLTRLLPDGVLVTSAEHETAATELGFVVPEYLTSSVVAPEADANVVLSYTADGGRPEPDPRKRLDAYMAWLEEHLDAPRVVPSLVAHAPLMDSGNEPALVMNRSKPSVGVDRDALSERLGRPLVEFDVPLRVPDFDRAVLRLVETIGGAQSAVTTDVLCAQLAAVCGVPTVLAGDDSELVPNFADLINVVPYAATSGARLDVVVDGCRELSAALEAPLVR